MEFYPKSIYYPLEAVQEKFESGELELFGSRLIDFIKRHKSEIIVHSQESSTSDDFNEALLEECKRMVLSKGSIHPAYEMAQQIQEIQKEVWVRREKSEEDPQTIAEEWPEKFAGQYREARIFEAFFMIDKMSSEILKLLKA